MKITKEIIKKLPKTDLHVHLDGSLRVESIFELAEKQKIKLPYSTERDLKNMICCDDQCESLVEYLQGFDVTLSVMQTEESLFRIAYELAEDAAEENIRYLEVRFSPILHTKKQLSLSAICKAVIKGLKQAENDFNIKTGVIICGLRHMEPTTSKKLAEVAVAFKNKGVVGFDLAGAEDGFPARQHKEAFDLAQKHNLNITVHAGEAYGAQSIHQALHYCGAHRIGHGTRLFEDNDLMNYVNDHRIPLEVCLTSNLNTKVISQLKEHPMKLYLQEGLRVTLNTDNRLISSTTLTDEYMIAINELGLDYSEIKKIILNGFRSAFLPYKEKERLRNEILNEIEAIERSVN